ncbi:TPA: N-6 DNA methylase, partial [Streptococcus suis]|nr:N-6 DNA methylase [Streptococcus suis]HEL2306079.1 N-6 DNA methylase [Streptococcus suis]HEL2308155.1 N-6 DNA methylase [Streptococcus suis]
MTQEQLLEMLRARLPRDQILLESFLRYQAVHFDEDWDSLIQNFTTQRGVVTSPVQVVRFETEVSAFVKASPFDGVTDLSSYTQTFGQAGLKKLPQLNNGEKALVIEVALFNLATRFQLLDQEGAYQSISVASLLDKSKAANLVNVYRVANNLSDRISRDIEQFLLTYEPELISTQETVEEREGAAEEKVVPEPPQDITFREEGGIVIASLEEDLSQLDLRTGQTEHLPDYEHLNLSQKFEILSHFDQVRNSRPKLTNLRRGEFDHEMEMTPIYEDNELLTYLEADGTAYDLQRLLTPQEEVILAEMGQTILAENTEKLTRLGIDLADVDEQQRGILIDAAGRFHLKNADLALLGGYPKATVTQLALATELLQMGLTHDKTEFFLTSQLDLEELRPITYAFLHEDLTLEEARTFERDKLSQSDLSFREWREHISQTKPEIMTQSLPQNPIVEEALKRYPIASIVTYKGQEFQVMAIGDSGVNNLIRIELQNDFTDVIEQNPVLFLRTLEDITQALHVPSVEEKEEVEETQQELDLFSFMDMEEQNEPVSQVTTSLSSNKREAKQEEALSEYELEPEVTETPPATDFHFPEDLTGFYPKTTRDKVETNVAAIRLVKKLEAEHRQATPSEQELLAKYVGWGGLANEVFNEYNPKFSKEREALKTLVTDKEYSDMKQSSLTAYYTDPHLIRQMWEKLERDGFTGGKILDPSMGTGNFFAAMPKHLRENSELYGVELDTITGEIAKHLHPNVHIEVKSFETVNFNENSFDLVLSNVPFANIRIADSRYDKPYMIHDYFVKKSLDLVHDGGQVAIISSTGTMDKRTENILQDIRETTDFLGGVRLPDSAFKAIAGTNVTTDMLFFQKHMDKGYVADDLAFSGSIRYDKDDRIWLNPYFDGDYNSQVLGTYEVRNFNGGTLSVKGTSDNLLADVQTALKQVKAPRTVDPSDILISPDVVRRQVIDTSIPSDIRESLDRYSFGYKDSMVYYRDNKGIRVGTKTEEISYYVDEEGTFKGWDTKHSQKQIDRFNDLEVTDSTALDVYVTDEATKRGQFKGYFKKTVFYEAPLSEKEVARIITGDYDAIVIGDSQFEKIPMSHEKQVTYIQDKLQQLRDIKQGSDSDYTVKEAERSIKGLEHQLEELQKLERDTFIEFENLGIDFLFVDEAHHFKNIRPITGLGNVAGITNTTSKKNVDMEMKVRQVQGEHDYRNVVFATGTPVSNSISELYTMMSYIQPDVLERYQVSNFDSWVGAFGNIENSMELAPTGDKYQPKKRFKKFVNLPELMRIYKETADIQTSDMLDLPVPEAKIIAVESELTQAQKYYLEELVERSDAIKSGSVDPSRDNMLK